FCRFTGSIAPGATTPTVNVTTDVTAEPGTETGFATGLVGPPGVVVPDGPVEETAPVTTNQAPSAVDDAATTAEDTATTIAVLGNDSDADHQALTVTGTSGVDAGA